ncbi:MAG: SanA/YdcF family protein [Bacillota bacterium]
MVKKLSARFFLTSAIVIATAAALLLLIIYFRVESYGSKYIFESGTISGYQVAIVPGAYVTPDGHLCDMLRDRVDTAVDLYKEGKVKKILMTGDHGSISYDEVNSMRRYAESRGVPTSDIFMDHAGFSTYDSMYRARDVFVVDSAVIVTQKFHLPRAVYIARKLGIKAVGTEADRQEYAGDGIYVLREIPARLKAFAQVNLKSKPAFLGPEIPVSGDGRATHDQDK